MVCWFFVGRSHLSFALGKSSNIHKGGPDPTSSQYSNETPQVKLVSCKSLKAKKHHMEAHQPASQPFTDTIVCNLLLFFSELKQQFLFFFKKKVFLGMTLDGWWWAVMMSRELKIVRLTTDRWMNISQNIVNRRNDHVRRCVSLVA